MNIGPPGRVVGLVLACGVLLKVSTSQAGQTSPAAGLVRAVESGQTKLVDLTHALDDQSPYWPEGAKSSPFHAKVVATMARDGYFARDLELPEHLGTHLDAPMHFDPRGLSVDQIPPQSLFRPAVVVDVRAAASSRPDYRLTVADLENWVKAHGPFPVGCIVLVRTGWASRWPSQTAYMNQDAQGVMHFPGFSPEAARYLLESGRPVAIGIDTASVDYGPSKDFAVHHLTMAAGLYHLENLANLDLLPSAGATLVVLPMKLRGGSGSPARVLAFVPNESSRAR